MKRKRYIKEQFIGILKVLKPEHYSLFMLFGAGTPPPAEFLRHRVETMPAKGLTMQNAPDA